MDTTVRKAAPDGYEYGCYNDRTKQGDTAQERFTGDLKVEDPNNQKNGQ